MDLFPGLGVQRTPGELSEAALQIQDQCSCGQLSYPQR